MRTVLFLRRVNVGGSHLKMVDLLETVSVAGYRDCVSVLASGNVIVSSSSPVDTDSVVDAIEKRHGFVTEVFMRSEDEVRRIVTHNPFPDSETKVEVVLLARQPDDATIEAIAAIASGPDSLHVIGTEIYWQRSQVDGRLVEPFPKETDLRKVLGGDSTRRTIGTVERVVARLDSMEP